MESSTMIIRKDSYLLLELMESLDKRSAEAARPNVERNPTDPENVRALKRLFHAKLPSFQVDGYLLGRYESGLDQ